MPRKTSPFVLVGALSLVLFGLSASLTAAPIRLARHPDYHAGKVAFSYLGDIWIANEDGTNVCG
jgi:tricorn protease